MLKFFKEWFGLKEKLHDSDARSPLVRERDLWWFSLGENIGSEMNGKSKLFSRPGLVLKKLSHGFFLIAPTTSKEHEGSWYVKIKQMGKDVYVCLHQIRAVDYRRFSTRLGIVDEEDFRRVKQAFWELYK